MSELPGRPNIDQLRRQARELLRAAAADDPAAVARIRVVSQRVSLSAAQLAVAREHGFTSWPALHAEIERRLAKLRTSEEATLRTSEERAETRWSFGGEALAIETAAGTLYPGGLVAGQGHAILDASLKPTPETRHLLTVLATDGRASSAWDTADAMIAEAIDAVDVADDRGRQYALRIDEMGVTNALHVQEKSGSPDHHGRARGPVTLRLVVDPVPARDCGWLEIRGQHGSAARLVPSAHPFAVQLIGADQDVMQRQCSTALARAAQIGKAAESQQSGGPDTAEDLPGQLTRLCAALTGHDPASGLPGEWSSLLGAADRTDGAARHLDLSVTFPQVDDTVMRVDSLVSEPGFWQVYLRAEPAWFTYSADRLRKWAVMSVAAKDDQGGTYLSLFGGSHSDGNYEELALKFMPRLDPLARALTLTFRGHVSR